MSSRAWWLAGALLLASLPAVADAPSVLTFSVGNPWWIHVEFTASVPGTIKIRNNSTYSAPSGDPNATHGGYGAFQRHLLSPGKLPWSSFFVFQSGCVANVTVGAGASPGADATFEPPICQLSTSKEQTSSTLPISKPGSYRLLVARSSDYIAAEEITVELSPGLSVAGSSAGTSTYFVPVEHFEGGVVAAATGPLLLARAAVNVSLGLDVQQQLYGLFSFPGGSANRLSVEGPKNQSGAVDYFFFGEPAGPWTFKVHEAAAPSFGYAFLVDAP